MPIHAALLAITIAVTGEVQEAGPGQVCGDAEYVIDCLGVPIAADGLDLGAYVGQTVRLVAVETFDPCGSLDVLAVEPAPATLTLCGTAAPGCAMRLRSAPGGAAEHIVLGAGEVGFVPIGPNLGTLLLNVPIVILFQTFSAGFEPAGAKVELQIPNSPALVGLEVRMQAARRDILPIFPGNPPVGPWRLSNVVCLDVAEALGACAPADC